MDLVELGGLLGAAAASFGASWLTFARPLKRQLEESAQSRTPSADQVTQHDLDEVKDELRKDIKEAVEEIKRDHRRGIEKIENRCTAIETRQNTAVTTEEFSAFTTHSSQTLNQLTEKIGRVTGVMEAWARK